jgi:uncharacterized damage-inducible protein DinB
MDEIIHTLFKFEEWANARVLASLRELAKEDARALQLMAHLLTAQKIWLLRLNGHDTVGTDKSPEMSLAQCELLANENHQDLSQLLAQVNPSGMDSMIAYKNLSGKEFTTSARDILLHVAMHSTYHRGQIALALRAAGTEPPNTDFITFVRESSRVP